MGCFRRGARHRPTSFRDIATMKWSDHEIGDRRRPNDKPDCSKRFGMRKMACQLCFWAAKAGACGRIGEFRLPPNEQTDGLSRETLQMAAGPAARDHRSRDPRVAQSTLQTGTRPHRGHYSDKLTCSCGCKGWCSFCNMLAFLDWSPSTAASWVYPSTLGTMVLNGPVDNAWRRGWGRPTVAHQIDSAPDQGRTGPGWGFPSWNSTQRPCFMCAGFGESLYEVHGTTVHDLPWPLNTDACSRSRVLFFATQDNRNANHDAAARRQMQL